MYRYLYIDKYIYILHTSKRSVTTLKCMFKLMYIRQVKILAIELKMLVSNLKKN